MTMTSRQRRMLASGLAAALVTTGLSSAIIHPATAAGGTPITITPNPAYQGPAFDGWGASLAWFANATGGYPESVRNQLLDKVFGKDGLNLNIARYNIGGGNASDVSDYMREGAAVQGWWNPTLNKSDTSGQITSNYADRDRYAAAWDANDPQSYNFDADKTQRWWLKALKDKITKWEAFSNSPPYFMTNSGYVSGALNDGSAEQLKPTSIDMFTTYLKTVVEHLEASEGIKFNTIEPFNEPMSGFWKTLLGSDKQPLAATTDGESTRLMDSTDTQADEDTSQRWILSTTTGRNFTLVNAKYPKALSVWQEQTADGTKVHLWQSSLDSAKIDNANQQWSFTDIGPT